MRRPGASLGGGIERRRQRRAKIDGCSRVDLKDIIPDNADRDIIKITGVTYHVADTKSETQANGGDDTKEQATPALIPDYGIIVQHWDSSRKFRENSYIRFLRIAYLGQLPRTIVYRAQLVLDYVLSTYTVQDRYLLILPKMCLYTIINTYRNRGYKINQVCNYKSIVLEAKMDLSEPQEWVDQCLQVISAVGQEAIDGDCPYTIMHKMLANIYSQQFEHKTQLILDWIIIWRQSISLSAKTMAFYSIQVLMEHLRGTKYYRPLVANFTIDSRESCLCLHLISLSFPPLRQTCKVISRKLLGTRKKGGADFGQNKPSSHSKRE